MLYIAPFRSAILYQMLVVWSESSRMIVFAECAVSCKAVPLQFASAEREARMTITGRMSALPDARPKEITLPCPLAKHSAAVRRQGGDGAFRRPAHFQSPLPLKLLQLGRSSPHVTRTEV